MKIKIEIKHYLTGAVLFEFEKENNTLEETLIEGVKRGADLRGAYLCDANLCDANLCGADLCGANLRGAYLCDADLRDAYLCGADLRGAYLCDANLRGAYLCDANLCDADLRDADLHGADLCGANLRGAKNTPFIPFSCPSDGAFIGWKKIKVYKEFYEGYYLVKLEIPEDAKRCSSTSHKCRCDKARVLEITRIEDGKNVDIITNTSYGECVYKVDEMVIPDGFDENRWKECSNGIHFFINKQQAIDY